MSSPRALPQVGARRWLRQTDPRLKLALLVWISVLSVLIDALAGLCVLAALGAGLLCGLTMRLRAWAALLGIVAALVWATVFSQALFYEAVPRTEWFTLLPSLRIGEWSLPPLVVYREGFGYGLKQSLRGVSVMLAGLSVCLSTSPDRLLAALAWLRVPPALGFMTVTALRFLPLLVSEWAMVRQARRLRGWNAKRTNWRARLSLHSLAGELAVLRPLLAWSLRRAATLATSVTVRGFDPARRRTFYPPLRMTVAGRVLCAGLLLSLTAAAAAKLLYVLYVRGLYYHAELRPLYDLVRRWM